MEFGIIESHTNLDDCSARYNSSETVKHSTAMFIIKNRRKSQATFVCHGISIC